MMSRLVVLGAGAALAVAGWAAYTLVHRDTADEIAYLDEHGAPEDQREAASAQRARMQAVARGTAQASALFRRSAQAEVGAEPEPLPTAEATAVQSSIGYQQARSGFDYVMRNLETLRKERRRLNQVEWKDAYRAANDAFAALSMNLDASDPEQAAELERAHRRLVRGLKRTRVRGRKFGTP